MYNGSNYTNLYHSFTLANVAELIVDYVDGVLSATINGNNLTSKSEEEIPLQIC